MIPVREGRPRIIRPTGLARAACIFVAGLLTLMAAGAIAGGVVALAGGHTVGLALLAFGAVIALVGLFVNRPLGGVPRQGRLTVTMWPDHIELRRGDAPADRVRRGEVGLVAIYALQGRVGRLEIFGSDLTRVGRWETGTARGPFTYTRALGRLDYPWVVRRQDNPPGRTTRRSSSAPSWADAVLDPS